MQNFFRYAHSEQEGVGAINMAVNGSVTPQDFWKGPRAGEQALDVFTVIFYLQDTGSFDSGGFGNGAALTNGVKIDLTDASGNVYRDLLDGEPIKTNAHFARLCYDTKVETYGAGDEYLVARWRFARSDDPLHMPFGRYMRITIQDDLSGLNAFTANFQGLVDQ